MRNVLYTHTHTHTWARNNVLDVMKGVTILLMVYAHVSNAEIVNRVVFSFHMPLFFLLGGYFIKDNNDIKQQWLPYTIKSAKRLLLPYFVTMFLMCLWVWRFEIVKLRFNLSWLPLLNVLWGSGDMLVTQYGRLYVGPLWFLFAIFVAREVFYLIQCIADKCFDRQESKYMPIVLMTIVLSVFSIVLYPFVQPLPWNPLPGIAALMFFVIGWSLRKIVLPLWLKIALVVCWVLVIVLNLRIDLRACEYGIIPLNVLGACGGTLVMYYLSKGLEFLSHKSVVINCVAKFMTWCGMGSLAILCMHSLDLMGGVSSYFSGFIGGSSVVKMCLHFAIPLLLTWIIYKIGVFRKIYY